VANNYNGARRAPIVFARDGAPRLVLRRETYDDLLRRDLNECISATRKEPTCPLTTTEASAGGDVGTGQLGDDDDRGDR
jgi:hypothetical protein